MKPQRIHNDMNKTKISWCDSTLNFWEGCTKVSEGCANCYAEARDRRFTGGKHWGVGAPRRKSLHAVKQALAMNRLPWICDSCGTACKERQCHICPPGSEIFHLPDVPFWHRRRVFSLSLADWLDDEVPTGWLAEMMDTIQKCSEVTWILCTKRPELFFERMDRVVRFVEKTDGYRLTEWETLRQLPENVIVLTSVENQDQADARVPALLKIPAAWHGLSLEPLLGPVDVTQICADESMGCTYNALTGIGDWSKDIQAAPLDWLIIGGESGPKARPCNVDWIRGIVRQGESAGVPVFVKQLGANPQAAGRCAGCFDPKGGDPAEWPTDLRVREWPNQT